MRKYDVYVQDKFYKTFELDYVNEILTLVNEDISNNLVADYDNSLPPNITIKPSSN